MTATLPNIDNLPDNFTMPLASLTAIRLSGEEQKKYLQGQVTCDVNEQTASTMQHGAHCDAKGKVLSIFRLIEHQDALLLIQPSECIEQSLAELKKFGVFAKVDIAQANDLRFTAFVGEQNAQALKTIFDRLPDELTPVVHNNESSLVYIAGRLRRYLLISDDEQTSKITSALAEQVSTEELWQLLEITDGFPLLNKASVQQFVPQMLNLDKIDGISFTKGCYLGQETVARMQYLGKNKKMMVQLTGKLANELNLPVSVEKQLGDNWRNAGDVLSHYLADDGTIYIQTVVSSDTELQQLHRIKGNNDTHLSVVELPYQINA